MQIDNLAGDLDQLPTVFDPARTAVLAIHWQRGIAAPDDPFGSVFGPVIAETGAIPKVAQLFRTVRSLGCRVIHINICNPPNILVNNPIFQHAKQTGALPCGSDEVRELEELSDPSDVSLDHHRVSAFADTDLEAILKKENVNTVAVTGIATNVAVESTARQAIDLGFYVVVLEDCCIAGSVERHRASIENLRVLATRVMSSDEFVSSLRRS